MKVLVTGAGGQIGQSVVDRAPANTEVIGLRHRDLDITDEAAVSTFFQRHRPDLIVNAAAYTAVDRAESEPDLAWRVNADGARHLAHAADAAGARLLHLSTDFVFDGLSTAPYAPDAEARPLNAYGRSKLAGERAVLETRPEHSVVVRTAWVHASAGKNFVLSMLRLMAETGSVRVVADQSGTPTDASSVAEAIWAIAARPDICGIRHWADAGMASWYDFAVAIAEESCALGLLHSTVSVRPIATRDYPTPARRPSYSVLDLAGLPELIGLEPVHWRVNLRRVLRRMRDA